MDSDTIKEIVKNLTEPTIVELGLQEKIAFIPEGMRVVDLKSMMPPPDRPQQRVSLFNVESFLAYTNRFMDESTTIFANESTAQYEAVIDYHPDIATRSSIDKGITIKRGTQDHIATYECPASEQWKAWRESNGKWFDQLGFAAFLETNLPDIAQPPGAVFLEIALQLQVHKAAQFTSDVRLDNGQTKFRYEETVRGTTKAGDLDIPAAFTIKVPVFVDGSSYELGARFRYRMSEGKLSCGYELIRPLEIWQKAVKEVTETIRKGTKATLHAGARV